MGDAVEDGQTFADNIPSDLVFWGHLSRPGGQQVLIAKSAVIATLTAELASSVSADVLLVANASLETANYADQADASAALAANWARKTDGIADDGDYSAKAWAIGGTGVSATASKGASKEWATKTDGNVDTSDASAKAYAVGGTGVTNTAGRGAAKEWASKTPGSTVDGTEYSAKHYASSASTSAASALASAASASAVTGALPRGNRTYIRSLDTNTITTAYCTEVGYLGMYLWDPLIAATVHQAGDGTDYIVPNTGSAGAWRKEIPYGSAKIRAAVAAIQSQRSGGKVALIKTSRSATVEFQVYTQMGAFSPKWLRYICSNHSNATSDVGQMRRATASLALLYKQTKTLPPPAIQSAGSNNDDLDRTARTWATGSGSETGSWSSTSLNGHTVRYSTTTGDAVVYTVSGIAMVALRGATTTNGGVVKVEVKQAGVEIASGYLVPSTGGERLIDLAVAGGDAGLFVIPLATLDPTLTYTVTVTRHSSSAVGGRSYQAGLAGWDAGWLTRPGAYAGILSTSATGRRAYFPASRVVYKVPGTRVDFRVRQSAARGIASLELYDATGNAVTLTTTTVDCYAASTTFVTTTLVSGLPRGDYYLHVIVSGTKNASATGYAIDHAADTFAAAGVDETTAGNPLVDTFDILDGSSLNTSSAIGSYDYSGHDASDERVYLFLRKSAEAGPGTSVGGVHGFETITGSPVFTIDGAVVSYSAASTGAAFVGDVCEVTFQTTLKFPSDSSTAGTATYTYTFTPGSYTAVVSDAFSADAKINTLYSWMMTHPNTYTGSTGIGDGFTDVTIEPRGQFVPNGVSSETTMPRRPTAVAVWNDKHVLAGWPIGVETLEAQLVALGATLNGQRLAHHADQSMGGSPVPRSKIYCVPVPAQDITIPSGTTLVSGGTWCAFELQEFGQFAGV